MSGNYDKQDRGDAAAYANYFAGMDRSMRQKIALISSYMPTSGVVADMGSGSGTGSLDMAALYPSLHVVGVDINPVAVKYSEETHKRANLSFKVGDIAEPNFEANSLNGILNSSVLHHVTSFNDFSLEKIYRLLDSQAAQLQEGGILAIRDFVVPDGPDEVVLELPETDGKETGAVPELSTAALYEQFTRQFRCARFPSGGVPLIPAASKREGYRCYQTSHRLAAEFILRKDYRRDWDTEILEEYTYFSKAQFEQETERRGLRILLSRHLHNPWIVKNRFAGKIRLLSLEGSELEFPPTNYILVAEKSSGGIKLRERSSAVNETPGFLLYRKLQGLGVSWDLVCRPQKTVDVVPWYRAAGDIYVICRQGYPRPVCNSAAAANALDGLTVAGYISEPISALTTDINDTDGVVRRILSERGGIGPESILNIEKGLNYFPSPGGIDERVTSVLVEVKPPGDTILNPTLDTGFSTPGKIRAVSAAQTLRAYQVGGMLDSRLELNIYALLLKRSLSPGPWIDAEINLTETPGKSAVSSIQSSLSEKRAAFTAGEGELHFLELRNGIFEEVDRSEKVISEKKLEYVIPKAVSTNTVCIVPYKLAGKCLLLALEERDLPAAQLQSGNSKLLTVPAFRIPKSVATTREAKSFFIEGLRKNFGAEIDEPVQLGGSYYPTPGVTPESVMLFAAPVQNAGRLTWYDAQEIRENVEFIEDGHLLTAFFRLMHAAHFFD